MEKTKKTIRQKIYLNNRKGAVIESIWTDCRCVQGGSKEYSGYPTQKPIALLERIIKTSSNEGDLIADFFSGSGTTGVAAARLGRRFILCDESKEAMEIAKKRILEIKKQ